MKYCLYIDSPLFLSLSLSLNNFMQLETDIVMCSWKHSFAILPTVALISYEISAVARDAA